MGLHFHNHSKATYREDGRREGIEIGHNRAVNAHNAKDPYDRLNTELELHILSPEAHVTASEAKRHVSDAALALKHAVHNLRHPVVHKANLQNKPKVTHP